MLEFKCSFICEDTPLSVRLTEQFAEIICSLFNLENVNLFRKMFPYAIFSNNIVINC